MPNKQSAHRGVADAEMKVDRRFTVHNAQENRETQFLPGGDGKRVADAIGAGLFYLPDAADMERILRRLEERQRLWLAAACLWSLPPETAEELAEATLADLRTGESIPPFDGLRAEARDWATFASRGELKAYLGAIWGRLPETERQSFLSAVRPKRRAA